MGNISQAGRVGMLFVDFEAGRRMRVDGTAELLLDHPLMVRHPGAQFMILVRAEAIYPNCPRYIHQYALVQRSVFVPRSNVATPTPDWKRSDWARDVLPSGDPTLGDGA
jgi:hypothetical protein